MSTLLAGTLLLTATGLFSQVVGFVYRMFLSRLIGAETMGLYQLVMPAYSMLMSVTAVGLTVAVSTLSARYHALGDSGTVRQILRRALGGFLLLAVPLGIAVAALSDPISVYLLGDARTRLGVVLLVPCVLLTGVENLHKHCFYGIGRVRPPAAVETAEQLIRAAAVLGLLAALLPRSAEETVGIIVLGMVLCEVFSACALTLLFQRHWRQFPPEPARDQVGRRRLFAIALPVGATSLLGTVLGCANSVLIPAKLVEGGMELSEAMSEFGVLCGMTLPLLGLPTGFIGALCLVMVPDLSRRTAKGDNRAAAGFLDRVMSATSLLMAPAMALLTVIGPSVGRAMFNDPRVGELMLPLAVGTLLGCFQSDEIPGKIQHGSAWWFNDTKSGMEDQMRSLANLGLLGNFVGMLTDSRSFLSYARHDYFRRILCNLMGSWVENGEYPNHKASLKKIVEGISYRNAARYFGV